MVVVLVLLHLRWIDFLGGWFTVGVRYDDAWICMHVLCGICWRVTLFYHVSRIGDFVSELVSAFCISEFLHFCSWASLNPL